MRLDPEKFGTDQPRPLTAAEAAPWKPRIFRRDRVGAVNLVCAVVAVVGLVVVSYRSHSLFLAFAVSGGLWLRFVFDGAAWAHHRLRRAVDRAPTVDVRA